MTDPKTELTAEETLELLWGLTGKCLNGCFDGTNVDYYFATIRAALEEAKRTKESLEFARKMIEHHVEAATPYFQCGGKYAHWLVPGQNIITQGIPALAERYEALKQRVEGSPKFSVSRLKKTGSISLAMHLSEQDPDWWEDVTVYAVPVEELGECKQSFHVFGKNHGDVIDGLVSDKPPFYPAEDERVRLYMNDDHYGQNE